MTNTEAGKIALFVVQCSENVESPWVQWRVVCLVRLHSSLERLVTSTSAD